jgi:hypothetical protein
MHLLWDWSKMLPTVLFVRRLSSWMNWRTLTHFHQSDSTIGFWIFEMLSRSLITFETWIPIIGFVIYRLSPRQEYFKYFTSLRSSFHKISIILTAIYSSLKSVIPLVYHGHTITLNTNKTKDQVHRNSEFRHSHTHHINSQPIPSAEFETAIPAIERPQT